MYIYMHVVDNIIGLWWQCLRYKWASKAYRELRCDVILLHFNIVFLYTVYIYMYVAFLPDERHILFVSMTEYTCVLLLPVTNAFAEVHFVMIQSCLCFTWINVNFFSDKAQHYTWMYMKLRSTRHRWNHTYIRSKQFSPHKCTLYMYMYM